MIPRYAHENISEIWAPMRVFERWYEIEVEHVRSIAGDDVAEVLRAAKAPTTQQVRYWERQSGHEMSAFLRSLDDNIQKVAKRDAMDEGLVNRARAALHYGLTSSDVMDTGMGMALAASKPTVDAEAAGVLSGLGELMRRAENKTTIARTHGQLAVPMSAGHRWEVLYGMFSRCYARTAGALLNVRIGKMSGPVGCRNETSQIDTLGRLGVEPTDSTQLVPRDRLANAAYQLSSLATVCEAIATQVWLLSQQGIAEIQVTETVSSSAMPHKRNPILAENIRGLARLARPLADQLHLGMVQWGEHDLAHSSVERVALPDLLHLVCTLMSRTATLVSRVYVVESEPPEGYRDTSGILRQAQAEGMAYVEAHEAIRTGRIVYGTQNQPYQGGKILGITADAPIQEGP